MLLYQIGALSQAEVHTLCLEQFDEKGRQSPHRGVSFLDTLTI